MNEDFRAKNIGQPRPDVVYRRDYEAMLREARERNRQYEADRAERLKGRVYRPLAGARVSSDYGKTWKLYCLCDECVSSVEPPQMLKNEGAAGAMKCDWCGALNEK